MCVGLGSYGHLSSQATTSFRRLSFLEYYHQDRYYQERYASIEPATCQQQYNNGDDRGREERDQTADDEDDYNDPNDHQHDKCQQSQ